MSYILDALKKAERERGISQIPTLATLHDVPESRRRSVWIVAMASIIILSAGFWFLASRMKKSESGETPERAGKSMETMDPKGQPRMHSGPAGIPETAAPLSRQETDPVNPTLSGAASRPPMPRESDAVTRFTEAAPAASTVPESESPIPPAPPRTAASKPAETGQSSNTPSAAAPSGGAEQNENLLAAMQGMHISILQYSDIPEERLVFINSVKYVEGDYIHGLYRIEKISPDGVVLSRGDEKATLKSGTN